MKSTLAFTAIQLISLCTQPKSDKITYKPHSYLPKATIYLPKGYTVEQIAAEGDMEYLYKYSDSSFFYISSFQTPHSYKEIRKANGFYEKENAFRSKKEFLLSGKDSSGLFWQDKTIKGLSIGFYKVKGPRLSIMKIAMNTLVVK